MPERKPVPDPTLLRICRYLRILERQEANTISSAAIADAAGVNAAQVRKDLSFFGEFGQPGVGYNVQHLLASLKRMMGLIVGVFDNNPAKIGHRLRGYEVMAFDRLAEEIADRNVSLAIIAVPRLAAQDVADALIAAGVRGLLNFAPVTLRVPDHVVVRTVDLTLQLETLAYHLGD